MDISKFKILKQVKRTVVQKHLMPGEVPSKVKWGINSPNEISFGNGNKAEGTCIRCKEPPCINLLPDEIKLNLLSQFPINTTCQLCPTNAINWPEGSPAPIIDEKLCIGCGLCASRCPAYAIFFKNKGIFSVNDAGNGSFAINKTDLDEKETVKTIVQLSRIAWENPLIGETDGTFKEIYEKILCLTGDEPNSLTKNILIQLGIKAGIRRTGDNYLRVDIIAEGQADKIGIGEIEFGLDILSTPRNTIDNMAVLISRYKIKKALPIIFPLILPNQRSEYWQVIKDIKNVLKMSVRTVTLGSLLLCLWNRKKISFATIEDLYSDADKIICRQAIEAILGRKLNISEGFGGIIEPQK